MIFKWTGSLFSKIEFWGIAGFLIFALMNCLPLLSHFSTHLYFPNHTSAYAWNLAWNCRVLETGNLKEYWVSNGMYPYWHAGAFAENMIGLVPISCPIWWASRNAIFTYNLSSILVIWFTAIITYFIMRKMTGTNLSAITGTLIFAFNHWLLRNYFIGHIYIIALMLIPIIIYANWMFWQKGTWKYLSIIAIFWYWNFLISVYLGIFLGVFIILWNLIWFLDQRELFSFKKVMMWIGAVALPWIAMIPIFWVYYTVTRDMGVIRTLADQANFTGNVWSWFSTSNDNWLWGQKLNILPPPALYYEEDAMFPGLIILILFASSFLMKKMPCWLKSLKWTALVLAILAIGPYTLGIRWKIPMPFILLWHIFPPLKATRNPHRFSIFVLLAIGFLAAYMLGRLRTNRRLYLALNIIVLTGICVETWTYTKPVEVFNPNMIAFYKSLYDPQKAHVLIELPYLKDKESKRLLTSTEHWNKVVNGVSGFWPPLQYQLERELKAFPFNNYIKILQALDVDWIVLHEEDIGADLHSVLHQFSITKELKFLRRYGTYSLWKLIKGESRGILNPHTDLHIVGPSTLVEGKNTMAIEVTPAINRIVFNPKAPAQWTYFPIAEPWIITIDSSDSTKTTDQSEWFAPSLFHYKNFRIPIMVNIKNGSPHKIMVNINIYGEIVSLEKEFQILPIQKLNHPLPVFLKLPVGFQPIPLEELKADFAVELSCKESESENSMEGSILIHNPGPYYWLARDSKDFFIKMQLICDKSILLTKLFIPYDLFPGDTAKIPFFQYIPDDCKQGSLVVNLYASSQDQPLFQKSRIEVWHKQF